LSYGNKIVARSSASDPERGNSCVSHFPAWWWRATGTGSTRHSDATGLPFSVSPSGHAGSHLLFDSAGPLLFERGAFTAGDTLIVSRIQVFLVTQIPFYLLTILRSAPVFVEQNVVLMYAAMINLFFKIVLNYILINWLGLQELVCRRRWCV